MAIVDIESFAGRYGLGMVHADVPKFLPPKNDERTGQLAVEAETQLRAMIAEHAVEQALQVGRPLLDKAVRGIAAFHALAHDLGIYHGSAVTYFTEDEDNKGFYLLNGVKSTIDIATELGQDPMMYDLDVAIRSKHGGLEEKHRPGMEHRQFFNLSHGLGMSMHESGLAIYTRSLSPDIFNDTQQFPRQTVLNILNMTWARHIGDLIPQRGASEPVSK